MGQYPEAIHFAAVQALRECHAHLPDYHPIPANIATEELADALEYYVPPYCRLSLHGTGGVFVDQAAVMRDHCDILPSREAMQADQFGLFLETAGDWHRLLFRKRNGLTVELWRYREAGPLACAWRTSEAPPVMDGAAPWK